MQSEFSNKYIFCCTCNHFMDGDVPYLCTTIIALIITFFAWLYFALWIQSAGTPTEAENGIVSFEQNGVIQFTFWFSTFMAIWMIHFAISCQNMLIGGAITVWYFTSNKRKLDKPIFRSAYNMMKYHLGTVSLSSLILAFLEFFKLLIDFLEKQCRNIICIQYYLEFMERWIRYFAKNATIITSMHGYSFRQAGSKAFKLIRKNIAKVLTICITGDYVFALAKIVVSVVAAISGFLLIKDKPDLEYPKGMLFVFMVMTYNIADCFFGVYVTAIDTIFICFCEDCEMNDGVNSPYYMSRKLMNFVETSKDFVISQEKQKNPAPTTVAMI